MPLWVLAAAAILFGGAALLLVQVMGPQPDAPLPTTDSKERAVAAKDAVPAGRAKRPAEPVEEATPKIASSPESTGAVSPSPADEGAPSQETAKADAPTASETAPNKPDIDSVPIEALAARTAPEENVSPETPEPISSDTLSANDRSVAPVPSAAETPASDPPESVSSETPPPDTVPVETVAEPASPADVSEPQQTAEPEPQQTAQPEPRHTTTEPEPSMEPQQSAEPVEQSAPAAAPAPEPRQPARAKTPALRVITSNEAKEPRKARQPAQTERVAEESPFAQILGAPKPQPMTLGSATEPAKPAPKSPGLSLGLMKQPAKPAAPPVSAGAYAGKVHSAIARGRRKVSGASGSATVTFQVGPGGGIRGARVSRSSGNSQIDEAAIATVRSAGQLPPPPKGAKSTYSIQIYFR